MRKIAQVLEFIGLRDVSGAHADLETFCEELLGNVAADGSGAADDAYGLHEENVLMDVCVQGRCPEEHGERY